MVREGERSEYRPFEPRPVGGVARFFRTNAPSKPSRTKACRTFSTVRVRQPTAALILAQGQLQLRRGSRKDFHQEIVVPATDTAFHGDAVFARMLLQQR